MRFGSSRPRAARIPGQPEPPSRADNARHHIASGQAAHRLRTLAVTAGLIAATAGGASSQTYQERGAYLVNALAVCGNCHTQRDAANQPIPSMALAGGFAFDEAV